MENVTKKKPNDYVISSGKQYSVKQFIEIVLNQLNIKYFWRGKGIRQKCYDERGKCIIQCDKKYFRPLEVDSLIGDSRKARKELNWKPTVDIKSLVKEMIANEFKLIEKK